MKVYLSKGDANTPAYKNYLSGISEIVKQQQEENNRLREEINSLSTLQYTEREQDQLITEHFLRPICDIAVMVKDLQEKGILQSGFNTFFADYNIHNRRVDFSISVDPTNPSDINILKCSVPLTGTEINKGVLNGTITYDSVLRKVCTVHFATDTFDVVSPYMDEGPFTFAKLNRMLNEDIFSAGSKKYGDSYINKMDYIVTNLASELREFVMENSLVRQKMNTLTSELNLIKGNIEAQEKMEGIER